MNLPNDIILDCIIADDGSKVYRPRDIGASYDAELLRRVADYLDAENAEWEEFVKKGLTPQ